MTSQNTPKSSHSSLTSLSQRINALTSQRVKPPTLQVPDRGNLTDVVAIVGDQAVDEMAVCIPHLTFGDGLIQLSIRQGHHIPGQGRIRLQGTSARFLPGGFIRWITDR